MFQKLKLVGSDQNNNSSIHLIHITNEPVDAIDLIRQKSESGHENDEPIYLCDISDVIQKHVAWKRYMPRVIPFYAFKCNDNPIIIQTLANLGTGFDCASKGEIVKVMSFGVPPERIIYANPNKPISHLKFAAKMKVDLMTVDSDSELQKISQYYPSARLVLRIRYDAEAAQNFFGEKFGCDPDAEAPKLIKLSKSLGLNMVGISFHVGSACMDPPVYGRAILAARKLFDFAESVGYSFHLLDIGGGFPGGNSIELKEYASIVNRAIDTLFPSSDVIIIAEPGRYYVASAFTLACQVHSKREIRRNGKISSMHYFINDGMFGSFACTRYQKVPRPLTLKSDDENTFKSIVYGPTMTGEDQVYDNILLPQLNIDDFIIFEDMGAYAMALACRFNRVPEPKIEYYIQRKHWDEMKLLRTDDVTSMDNNED